MGWLSNAAIRESKLLKKILKLVSYIIDGDGNVTGFVDADGNVVTGLTSYTWTQFTGGSFDLTVARYVHVSDKHSTQDATSAPGSLWWIDPSAASARKRQLVSGPLYHATLAVCPDPTAWPSLEVFPANVGVPLRSNGSVYRSIARYTILANNLSDITKGSSMTAEWQPYPVTIPRDINNNSLMRDGDYIEITVCWLDKLNGAIGATGDTSNVQLRFGPNNTTGDTSIVASTAVAGANYARKINNLRLARVSNTAVRLKGASGFTFNDSVLAVLHAANVTVSAIDNASTDYFFNIGWWVTAVTDTTSLNLRDYEVRLVRGY